MRYQDFVKITSATPAEFRLHFKGIHGIVDLDSNDEPKWQDEHDAQLVIPADYPFEDPILKPISSVFHPNVSTEKYCLFAHFPKGMPDPLSWMISQAVEVLQYREINLKDENARMNPRASEWVRGGGHKAHVPIKPMVRFS